MTGDKPLMADSKKLKELLKPLTGCKVFIRENPDIRDIKYDSRKINPGDMFVAVKGFASDGNQYIPDAVARGASVIVSESEPSKRYTNYWVKVSDARLALSSISAVFYNYPWKNLIMVGITGTNGKTTVTYLLKSIFDEAGYPAGIIGTIAYIMGSEKIKAQRTTPEAPEINQMLFNMNRSGIKSCAMEVSSHSLELKRVSDIRYDAVLFTNLTMDHLDYHQTMENYYQAKKKLFGSIKEKGFAVINIDNTYGYRLAYEVKAAGEKVVTIGKNQNTDIRIADYVMNSSGSRIKLDVSGRAYELETSLYGLPNIYNITSSFAAAYGFGISFDAIYRGIMNLREVEGRMQRVDAGQDFTIIVDYAHTPDALMNLLIAVRSVTTGRLITVFGCGGDRDRSKRPMMGQHAALMSDYTLVTSDNPRSESSEQIIADILVGILEVKRTVSYKVIPDRREAIKKAIAFAKSGDTVVIAGKGHEDYQLIGGKVIPFDDRSVAGEIARLKMESKL